MNRLLRLLGAPWTVGMALALLALAYRLLLLHTSLATVDADQAVLGLMARHILHGERPIFFYGQSYQGALEAYLTAAVFAVAGVSDLTLRLVPTLLAAGVALQLYLLGRRLYGAGVGLASGLWLALPAPVLAYWGTVAGAGYVEVVALGSGLLAVAVRRWGLGERRGYDGPLLGLLAGLGVWTQPIIAYYLLALALAGLSLTWRRLGRSRQRVRMLAAGRHRDNGRDARATGMPVPAPTVPAAAPAASAYGYAAVISAPGLRRTLVTLGPLLCFVAGAAPWLGYTLRHGAASFDVLSARAPTVPLLDPVGRLLGETLPLLVGGGIPATLADQFVGYVNTHAMPYAVAVLALGYLAVRLLVSPGGVLAQGRALLAGRPLADAPLALLPLVTVALYLASHFAALSWTTHNPRYLLPLYTSTPYIMACAVPVATRAAALRRRRLWTRLRRLAHAYADTLPRGPHAAGLYADGLRALARPAIPSALLIALAMNVYGSAHYQPPQRITPLAAALEARGDGAVYCLYWLAWRLAFESGDRLTPVVTRGVVVDPYSSGNRYPPYLERAAQARRWAYILPYDAGASALVALLQRARVPYARWHWGNATIFDGPVRPNFPALPAAQASASAPPAAAAGARP